MSDELGFALHPAYWGRGIMPEVVQAVVPGVVVPPAGLLDPGAGLLLALYPPHMADEAGALFHIFRLAVVYRETGHVIGSAGFINRKGIVSDELGFALHPAYW